MICTCHIVFILCPTPALLMLNLLHIFRLGISYPELMAMQARAIFEAAIAVNDQGLQVFPEIMVPLVGTPQVDCSFWWCLT